MESKKHLTDWLRDAHAMEEQAQSILKRQSKRLENYPELRNRIDRHIEETRDQKLRLERLLDRFDGGPSAVKDTVSKVLGNMSAIFNAAASDEVVKNSIANYAFEHFEIASYRSLIAAAEAVGDDVVARECRSILAEEEAMASWMEDHLAQVTKSFLSREEAGMEAKH
ncbi:MAG: ferritin-like domain-containing protein [Rhodothermales bacterium]